MDIKKAEFIISAAKLGQCPPTTCPEYAFIGRSNVGKSSLINMLTGRKGLAKTSATPGKTLLINFFKIDDRWMLVDLPGYGYAKRGKAVQEDLKRIIESYVFQREPLICLFVLVDIRLEPQKIDLEFIHSLGEQGVPFAIIFTKADKVSGSKAQQNMAAFKRKLHEEWEELPPMFATSSASRAGRHEVLDYIDSINQQLLASNPKP
ncbi:MAG: YihA family ribosome biogenesis GTP-binding protein [Alloprevotella sp.]|nr:YihA family ribosome biogenesis GTP-binding protein [Alloprevotella sp.]